MQNQSTPKILDFLTKHVSRFIDNNSNFSPTTIADGLTKIHGHQTEIKGALIATFNATHASDNLICPVTHGKFVPNKEKGYAKYLHMGTTRIWDEFGINEERWQKFVDFTTEGQDPKAERIVTQSQLHAYLKHCYQNDAEELNNGRNTQAFFSSKFAQGFAATAAWDEVFDRLACGWLPLKNGCLGHEPYINLSLIREFFEDSNAAFQKAEDRKLPVPKPTLLATPAFGR